MYRLEFLKSKAFFGGLEDTHLEKVVSFLREDSFKKGDTIMKEDEPGDRMFMIVKGNVDILKYNKKLNELEKLAELAEGDSFGEMELIDIQPRSASVVATEAVDAVSLSNSDMLKLSQQDIEAFSIILINIARIISRKLRKTDDRLVSVLHQ